MTAVRRSTGPRPGEPTGRGRAGRPRKYSPVGREGIGTSTVVRGKGGGGGGAEERWAPQESREKSSGHRGRHDTREETGDETRDSRQLRGAPSPAGTARIERELERSCAGTLPGRRLTT